jgi:hypothetical protein
MEPARAAGIEEGPGLLAPLVVAGSRSNMLSPALVFGSSTPGSAAAQALKSIMLHSTGGEKKWLLDEISNFNVPGKRHRFPEEASKALRETLDEALSLAISLHKSTPLAFSAFNIFVLFPRLLFCLLLDGCQGDFAAAALNRRYRLLREGDIATLLLEAHEARTGRVTKATKASSIPSSSTSFSKTTRAAILAGA